ncbi:unnamed protein product, partial [Rotaria magnacalcarata]
MLDNVNSTFYFLQLPSIQESTKIVEAAISGSTTVEVIITTDGMLSTTNEMVSTTDEVISTIISMTTSMVSGNTIAFQRSITIA